MMSADRKFRRGNRSTGERDEILGAALRRLEVPPPRPGFHADLLAMLGTAVSEPDVADPERPSTPRWAQPRRGRLRHPRGWMLGLAAAAAAVLTLFLGVANFPGTKPTTASAAEVQAAVARPRAPGRFARQEPGLGGAGHRRRPRWACAAGDLPGPCRVAARHEYSDQQRPVPRSPASHGGPADRLPGQRARLAGGPDHIRDPDPGLHGESPDSGARFQTEVPGGGASLPHRLRVPPTGAGRCRAGRRLYPLGPGLDSP